MFYISPHQDSFAQSVYFTLISVLRNVTAAFFSFSGKNNRETAVKALMNGLILRKI